MQIKIKVFAIFFLIIFNFSANSVVSSTKQTTKNKSTPATDMLREFVPIKQQIFLDNLEQFANQYKTSPNAIQKFLLRKKREKFINKNLKDRSFNEWVGRIKKLQTTENGEASLEIELTKIPKKDPKGITLDQEFSITVGSFKNASTDSEYKTLILPGSPLYNWLANFKEGEWIVFSGKSFLGDKDYLKMANLTEYEAMLKPQFIVKFEFFEKINLIESNLGIKGDKPQPDIKKENSRHNNLINTKTITIRYYQHYRLSNYNWDYQSFIRRWHKLVRYHWNNHPPSDYLKGNFPKGGEVFVLATVKTDGRIRNYKVNSVGEVSKNMRIAALEAVRAVPLPSLPEDYPDEELKVEFRFEHSQISHLFKGNSNQKKTITQDVDNKSNSGKGLFSKMEEKILKNQLRSAARTNYNEGIKHELSSHFHPIDRFEPNLELQIELAISNSGRVIQQKLTSPVKSVQFQLAIMNSLSKARFDSLPKPLISESPYRVLLKIIP